MKKAVKKSLSELIVSVFVIILAGFILSFTFFQVDLTAEKRYTLSDQSVEILDSLNDMVYVKVYLDGDLPPGFERMKRSVKQLLDEFRTYAGKNIQYQFINPAATTDTKERDALYKELYDKGLQPTNIQAHDEEGGASQKVIFPGALVVYNGVELPLNLLENNPAKSAAVNLNNSIETLEFKFIQAIKNITSKKVEKIAFIEGHGELNQYEVGDITKELANYYQVDRGRIGGLAGSLDDYEAVIIAKPTDKFPENDKFVLDQYIMHGGRVFWLIDPVSVSMDSLMNGSTMALIPETGLEDQLFRYGVRLNPDLVQDVQCAIIPVNTALAGNPAKFTPAPWLYFPLLSPGEEHPINKNIPPVKAEFASSIDTVKGGGEVHKTILLTTSQLSRTLNVPLFINLDQIHEKPSRAEFNRSHIPVAVLLEGQFESDFKNRILSGLDIRGKYNFKAMSEPTKMVVVADGDIIRNDVRNTPNGLAISPLGYDRYSRQTFGNKEFILNVVNYLTDETGIMKLRAREFTLRLLDKAALKEGKLKWQLINTIVPVLFVILFGIIVHFFRKRKYSR
ncbi:MAG TPA: gliding motility-associated ABC transporter substrate-binding protein GldG [Bacteroidales bacterium]|nr:gliding motility-associated ABC transporter substrate-binding protein GldG [Bacteroidales bacterium]